MNALKVLYNNEKNDQYFIQQIKILSDKVNYKKRIRNEHVKIVKQEEETIEKQNAIIEKQVEKLNVMHKFDELKAMLSYKTQQLKHYRNEYLEKVKKSAELTEYVKDAKLKQRKKGILKNQSPNNVYNKKYKVDINLIENGVKQTDQIISKEKPNYRLPSTNQTDKHSDYHLPKIYPKSPISSTKEKKQINFMDELFNNRAKSSKPVAARRKSQRPPRSSYKDENYIGVKPIDKSKPSKYSAPTELDLEFLKGYDNSNAGQMSHLVKKKVTNHSNNHHKNYFEHNGKMICINDSEIGINDD